MLKDNVQSQPFQFKQFTINQDCCSMKIGTDGVLLGAWANTENSSKVLDIGTGTGVIAIMLAQRTDGAQIVAVEIDEEACKQAQVNMEASPWKERLSAVNLPIQDFVRQSSDKFDLIVSNPPFFSGGTFSENQDRNNVRHTVKLPNGDLLNAARNLLSKGGKFCVILPYIEGLRFKESAQRYNLYCTKMTEVKSKEGKPIERLLLQFEHEQKPLVNDSLTIQHEARHDYTKEYIELTGSFYLNM